MYSPFSVLLSDSLPVARLKPIFSSAAKAAGGFPLVSNADILLQHRRKDVNWANVTPAVAGWSGEWTSRELYTCLSISRVAWNAVVVHGVI
jgi:hypothetical protein